MPILESIPMVHNVGALSDNQIDRFIGDGFVLPGEAPEVWRT